MRPRLSTRAIKTADRFGIETAIALLRPPPNGSDGNGQTRPYTDTQVRDTAVRQLSHQPRDASPTRLGKRDGRGRPTRGHLRAFGVSRLSS